MSRNTKNAKIRSSEIRDNRLQQPSGSRLYGAYVSTSGGSISGSLVISGDLYSNSLSLRSGNGLKVGSASASTTYGWRDIVGQLHIKGSGNDPAWVKMGTGPFYAHKLDVGKEMWFAYHVPHDYVPGTPVHLHTHWVQDGSSSSTVTFYYAYSFAKGFNQQAFDVNGSTATSKQAGAGIPWQHMISETNEITLTSIEVDSLIMVRLRRASSAESGDTSNSNSILIFLADIHYRSNGMATKNKEPNFYV